jgi:hypothetical protein
MCSVPINSLSVFLVSAMNWFVGRSRLVKCSFRLFCVFAFGFKVMLLSHSYTFIIRKCNFSVFFYECAALLSLAQWKILLTFLVNATCFQCHRVICFNIKKRVFFLQFINYVIMCFYDCFLYVYIYGSMAIAL